MAENPEMHRNGKNTEPKTEKPRTWTEQFEVAGRDLRRFIEDAVHEGNIRRLIVRQNDRVIVDLPLTVVAAAAIVTTVWAPFLAALGGVAGLLLMASGKFTVVVARTDKGDEAAPDAKTRVEVKGEDE